MQYMQLFRSFRRSICVRQAQRDGYSALPATGPGSQHAQHNSIKKAHSLAGPGAYGHAEQIWQAASPMYNSKAGHSPKYALHKTDVAGTPTEEAVLPIEVLSSSSSRSPSPLQATQGTGQRLEADQSSVCFAAKRPRRSRTQQSCCC